MSESSFVPTDKGLDHTLKLKKEGYLFIPNRMAQLDTDLFVTHLMAKRVICITGQDAVELFYDDSKFTREKAAPSYVKKTLFGDKTVHGLAGDAHTHRKELFLNIFNKEGQEKLITLYREYLQKSIGSWEFYEPVNLYKEFKEALTMCVCTWSGMPVPKEELKERADELMALVFGFGTNSGLHAKGKNARSILEPWVEKSIKDIRSGFIEVEEGTPIKKLCDYRELNGEPLDSHLAAVEMLNVIRPVVASSIYIVFAALALHEYPEYKEKLIASDEKYCTMFCQEVRRFYPLTPFLGAVVKEDFKWKGCEFKKDGVVLLDVHGINHSDKVWENPNEFDPDHFKDLEAASRKLIAQGGGDLTKGHRCPGEEMTVRILETSVDFLAKRITYDLVKGQDLSYDLSQIPTMPSSGIDITNIYPRIDLEEKKGR